MHKPSPAAQAFARCFNGLLVNEAAKDCQETASLASGVQPQRGDQVRGTVKDGLDSVVVDEAAAT